MINELKNQIRRQIRFLKNNISFEEKKIKSAKIFDKLEQNPVFKNSYCVLFYWAMQDEVQTQDFILKYAEKKQIILPSVKEDILILKQFNGIDSLKTGEKYGIQEPDGEAFTDYNKIDLVIVPGIAFDKAKNRMGRGKAYYDALLPKLNAYKIAVCFDFQLIENVPVDEHDIKMDEIITD